MASIVSHTATDTNRKRERECSRGITYAASFHCLVEEWRECEELKPRTSTMATFFGREALDGQIEKSAAEGVEEADL